MWSLVARAAARPPHLCHMVGGLFLFVEIGSPVRLAIQAVLNVFFFCRTLTLVPNRHKVCVSRPDLSHPTSPCDLSLCLYFVVKIWYDMHMATDYKRCSIFLSDTRVVVLARGLLKLKSFFVEPVQEFRERDRMLRPHRC